MVIVIVVEWGIEQEHFLFVRWDSCRPEDL